MQRRKLVQLTKSPKNLRVCLILQKVLDIDAVGTFNMCHAALKYLKKEAPGRDSSSAKVAVDATTRNLALEWGTDYDIRVNRIAPGPIGEKWDIAMAALYLSCDSGKYVSGLTLVVDAELCLSKPRHLAKEAPEEKYKSLDSKSADDALEKEDKLRSALTGFKCLSMS
ncbi:unnamed protein product [Arabidopsis thaliana]|uniref:2,4-dienoyl-CoA reductase [(3E)-enoyl-CoA-producing] n=1 Tax=Arabidopsis thaliana TaxID=3702 RepID=A0A7G2DYA4_ARATH|nr:unnamed protein product [Arabidopsis thaliana]